MLWFRNLDSVPGLLGTRSKLSLEEQLAADAAIPPLAACLVSFVRSNLVVDKKRTEPRVLNKYKLHKYPFVFARVVVMRPGKWGNPFVIGRDGTREEVVEKYEQYLLGNQPLYDMLHELTGRDLVCCCAPLRCHADVLVKHANKPEVALRAKERLEKERQERARQASESAAIEIPHAFGEFRPVQLFNDGRTEGDGGARF